MLTEKQALTFETKILLRDMFYGTRPLQILEIIPSLNRDWTFTLLTCFLNEMDTFQPAPRRAFTKEEEEDLIIYKFMFKCEDITTRKC